MLNFKTCKFSELLNIYADLKKVSNKTPKQVKLFKTVEYYLRDRFLYHFDIYVYSGQIMGDEIPENDLINTALTCWLKAGIEKVGRQKVYIDHLKTVDRVGTYEYGYGINSVSDDYIDFEKAISRDYH